jgi:hypothetical protein
VHGRLTTAEIIAAGQANRAQPDERQLLDSLVRDAVGAWKALNRGHPWQAAAGVERMRRSLLTLRGQRDSLRPDPADPAGALAAVIAEAAARFDFGSRRWTLLERIGVPRPRDLPAADSLTSKTKRCRSSASRRSADHATCATPYSPPAA